VQDAGDIVVVCGGVIPQQDYDELLSAGAALVFGPGAELPVNLVVYAYFRVLLRTRHERCRCCQQGDRCNREQACKVSNLGMCVLVAAIKMKQTAVLLVAREIPSSP